MSRYFKIFLLFLTLTSLSAPGLFAWDLEFGYQRLMPKLGTKKQEYENGAGVKVSFKPVVEKTILGQAFSLGLKIEEYLIQYEYAEYKYDTSIPAAALSTTLDTNADCRVNEKRIGVSYHLERELAGIYAGAGVTVQEERIDADFTNWRFSGMTLYLKYGIDLTVLSNLKVRAEQLHFRIGVHNAKINSFGLVFFF